MIEFTAAQLQPCLTVGFILACHKCCSGFPSPTRLQGWSPKCGTLADRLVVLRGVPDIGFSPYTVPTYNLVSEYFGVQEPRLGVGAEGCSTRVQVFGDA